MRELECVWGVWFGLDGRFGLDVGEGNLRSVNFRPGCVRGERCVRGLGELRGAADGVARFALPSPRLGCCSDEAQALLFCCHDVLHAARHA
jgi:hypothetical protein